MAVGLRPPFNNLRYTRVTLGLSALKLCGGGTEGGKLLAPGEEDMQTKAIQQYLLLAPPLVVLCGVMYLWGYWSTFNINIFEYAAWFDLLSSALIPIAGLILVIPFLALANAVFSGSWKARESALTGYELKAAIAAFSVVYVTLGSIIMLVPFSLLKWRIVAMFVAPITALVLFFVTKFSAVALTTRDKAIIATIYLAMAMSAPLGKIRAGVILEEPDDGPKRVNYEASTGHKYLGHANGYYFFLTRDNIHVIVSRADSHGDLKLTREAIDEE